MSSLSSSSSSSSSSSLPSDHGGDEDVDEDDLLFDRQLDGVDGGAGRAAAQVLLVGSRRRRAVRTAAHGAIGRQRREGLHPDAPMLTCMLDTWPAGASCRRAAPAPAAAPAAPRCSPLGDGERALRRASRSAAASPHRATAIGQPVTCR